MPINNKENLDTSGRAPALGAARQVRFETDIEAELEKIAAINGIDFSQAVRGVTKIGLPIYKKKKMGEALPATKAA